MFPKSLARPFAAALIAAASLAACGDDSNDAPAPAKPGTEQPEKPAARDMRCAP